MRTSLLKKTIKVFAIILVCSVAMVIGLSVWLVKSESGIRWALNQAPDVVSVSSVNGNLNDLSFSNLVVTLDGTNIAISSGQLQWTLTDLLFKRFNLQTLALNDVKVNVASTKDEPETPPFQVWQGIELPIDIAIETLVINRFTLSSNDEALIKLDQIDVALDITNNRLKASKINISQAANNASLIGTVDLSAKQNGLLTLRNAVQWSANEQKLDLEGSINGTWGSFEISQVTTSPLKSRVDLTVNDALSNAITWIGTLQTQESTVQLNPDTNVSLDQGNFDLSGKFSPSRGLKGLVSRLSGSITGRTEQFSTWELITDVEFANDALSVGQFSLSEQIENPIKSTGFGLDKSLSASGKLSVSGTIVGVSAFIAGQNNGNANADLSGSWQNLGWPITNGVKQINTSGDFGFLGVPENFVIKGLSSGRSYQRPLLAEIDVHVINNSADINVLKIRSGHSKIDVSGRVGDELALSWDLSSPDLSELLPGFNGDLISKGRLNGKTNAPRFAASAKSNSINVNGIIASGFNLNTNGYLGTTNEEIKLNASVLSVQQNDSELAKDVSIILNGSGQAHTLSVNSLLFGQSVFTMNAKGGLTDNGWLGKLNDLSLDDPTYRKWSLGVPISIERKGNKLTSEKACLENGEQAVCINVGSNSLGIMATGDVRKLELNNLNPLLSLYDVSLLGQLNGTFSYDKRTDNPSAIIEAQLQAKNSTVSVRHANSDSQTLIIESADVDIRQNQTLTAKARLLLENDDRVSAEISVAQAFESAEFSTAALNGRVFAELKDLSKFRAVTAPLSDLKGSLNADINLSGSVSQPSIGMQTELKNGQVSIVDLGLTLNQIEFSARSTGDQKITLDGSLNSGKGQLHIDGDLNFEKLNQPLIGLSIKGDNVELMNTNEIHIDGNLDTKIIITNTLIDVSGNVSLVQADLDFQLPENAILASEDVILLGEEQAQQSAQQKINLSIDLGNQAHIRAQGLDAYLVGKLHVIQEPGGVMRANGQIDIKDGRYDAYNQKLKIDKGQLIYNGGAVDDPSLLLRAQKTVDSITAGVSVTGRASSPILQLYSSPSMSDQDVLSVLIFDKKIGDLGSQDGLTLLKIANSLRGDGSKSQVDELTQNIQETLGLTNLELQLSGNSPSLVAGKQLSSKFYIGYGYGLLDAAQSLILRYKISQSWSIQGDVGADSGADLRYQIER